MRTSRTDRYVLSLGYDLSGEITLLDARNELDLNVVCGALETRRITGAAVSSNGPAPPGPLLLQTRDFQDKTGTTQQILKSVFSACQHFLTDKDRDRSIIVADLSETVRILAPFADQDAMGGVREFAVNLTGILYLKGYERSSENSAPVVHSSNPSETETAAVSAAPERNLDRVGVYSIVLESLSAASSPPTALNQFDLKYARIRVDGLPASMSPPHVDLMNGWKSFLEQGPGGGPEYIGLYDFLVALAWYRVARPLRQGFIDRYRALPKRSQDDAKFRSYDGEYFRAYRFATVVHDYRDSISLDAWVLGDPGSVIDMSAHTWSRDHPPPKADVDRFARSVGYLPRFQSFHLFLPDLILDRTLVSLPLSLVGSPAALEGRDSGEWTEARTGIAVLLASLVVFESDLFILSNSRAENLAYQLFRIRRHGVIRYTATEETTVARTSKWEELRSIERESMYLFSEFEDRFRFSSLRVQGELDSLRDWLGVKDLYSSLSRRLGRLVQYQQFEAEADDRRREKRRNELILLLTVTAAVFAVYQPLTTILSGDKVAVSIGLLVVLAGFWAVFGFLLVPQLLREREEAGG